MPADGSRNVVLLALVASLASAIASLWAAASTGASVLVAVGLLFLAAAGSQALMLVGLHRARNRAEALPRLARGSDLHVWCYVAALILFSFCAGVAVYEGIGKLTDAPRILVNPHTGYAAVAFALALNAAALARVIVETWHLGAPEPDPATLLASADPALVTTLIETVAALTGLVIAGLGIGLAHATGSPVADGNAALLVGLLTGTVAAIMGVEIRRLLVGANAALSAGPARIAAATDLLKEESTEQDSDERGLGEHKPRRPSRRAQKRRQEQQRRHPQKSDP